MDYSLSESDMAALSIEQKEAIFDALFLALAIDRKIDADEATVFVAEAKKVPWHLDDSTLKTMKEKARMRVKGTVEREQWLAWIKELASKVPTNLHEKLVATMARIAMVGGLNQHERGVLNAFLLEFGITQERAEALRDALSGKGE